MVPLIGITTATNIASNTGWGYNRAYVGCIKAVEDAGGLPVLIPISIGESTLRAIYDRVDAVLLPGGGDVRPSIYGAEPHPTTGNFDDLRDEMELQVARWAVAEDRPLLGICRGHQVMNVALGGTLLQDIPSEVKTGINHNITNPRGAYAHPVEIDPSSRLASILQSTQLPVNSIHHQGVDRPAPGLCVTAYAPDGVIEAQEMPNKKFVLSVQWHPEDLFEDNLAMKRLFRAFIEAAGGRPA